jgi:hypothetical protein
MIGIYFIKKSFISLMMISFSSAIMNEAEEEDEER